MSPVASGVGLAEQYAYLEESIGRFIDGKKQEVLAREAGFSGAYHRTLAGGLMGALVLL
jgi:demethylmenaquinone methyltransferase/2-methoxy-6-polyprenyl-1,4-benzoquinol methylase